MKKRIRELFIVTVISISLLFGSVSVESQAADKIELKCVTGSNRFITSLNITKEAFPNGSKNVILVTGTGVADGLVSSVLAAKLDAPVILTQPSVLSQDIINYCANTKNIFLIGGTGAISKDIEREFIDLKKTVYRIDGADRFCTAANIADLIRRIQINEGREAFSEIFIAKNSADCIDAANVSVISAKRTVPLLYSKESELNQSTLNYVKYNSNIKKVYLVGGQFSDNVISELKATNKQISIITGPNRYETNSNINKAFDPTFDNIIMVNNTVECISLSQLAVKKNAQLIMVSDYLTETQKNLIKNNNIETIYYLNNEKMKKVVNEIRQMKCTAHTACINWISNKAKTAHWKVCTNCEKTLSYGKCTPSSKIYSDEKNKMQYQICTVCNGKTKIRYLNPDFDYITDGFNRMVPILKQSDPRWGTKRFQHSCDGTCWKNYGSVGATISTHSCGPASVAMIISGLTGEIVTPLDYNNILGVRYKSCTGSSYEIAYNPILTQQFGLTSPGIKKDGATSGYEYMKKVIEWTNQGYMVFAHSTAHFIAIISAGKDKVYILDPAYDSPIKDANGNWVSYTANNAVSEYKKNTKSIYNNYKGKDIGQWYVPLKSK